MTRALEVALVVVVLVVLAAVTGLVVGPRLQARAPSLGVRALHRVEATTP